MPDLVVIATGLSGFAPENAVARWIADLRRDRGYLFHLVYLWLPDVEQNIRRVAGRVRHGGHSVPEDVIRRRYTSGLANFLELFVPIADSWALYDNSDEARLVAKGELDGPEEILDAKAWKMIEKLSKAGEQESAYKAGARVGGIMGVPIGDVTESLRAAGRDARRRHKALGHPIVILRGGKVVEVPPEEIEVTV